MIKFLLVRGRGKQGCGLEHSKTAEDADRAYDEAARMMCGSRERTNFPYNPLHLLLKVLGSHFDWEAADMLQLTRPVVKVGEDSNDSSSIKSLGGSSVRQQYSSTCLRLDSRLPNDIGVFQWRKVIGLHGRAGNKLLLLRLFSWHRILRAAFGCSPEHDQIYVSRVGPGRDRAKRDLGHVFGPVPETRPPRAQKIKKPENGAVAGVGRRLTHRRREASPLPLNRWI
ncbi:uncharacterized protein LOC116250004 [Nymphaea colorata]|uniref:uncharacterized protein LOC116250004 n=1 Tax=Nymphaea colorata TaxID=210225 RepID=UPI00214E6CE1|nr:uncharacterized protein LOC116250004 [Nymphaea colorata]